MPTRFAVQNGDWNNTATWNYGSVLGIPTGSDDVFSNNFTVNINQSFVVNTLNNASSFAAVATPIMTSNTTPSPYAVNASNELNSPAWAAFDRNATTAWQTTSGASGVAFLIFDFSAADARVIKAYSIFTQALNFDRNPRVWTFDGSNDGSTWVTLDSVTLGSSIGVNSVYNSSILANTTAYRYYRLNVTATTGGGGVQVGELALWETGSAFINTGGSFNFNSGSISGSVTSTTPLSAGATNLITVTAATGSVGLTLGGAVVSRAVSLDNLIVHSGNCDLRLSGTSFTAGAFNSAYCINKTSAGTIIITGSLNAATAGSDGTAFNSTAGNTIVLGNIVATLNAGGQSRGINQTAGNITVIGNIVGGTGTTLNDGIRLTGANSILIVTGSITGGGAGSCNGVNLTGGSSQIFVSGSITGGSNATAFGANFTGLQMSINGNIIGGSVGASINTTAPTFVTGNVTGSAAAGIVTTAPVIVTGSVVAQGAAAAINAGSTATFINVSGSVISSATANAITATNASAVVNLAGNMVNTSGKTAIYCQNLFLSNTATTQAQFFTIGSQDRTLYSADTFPNLPSASNVRFGTTYGPGSGNTGTLRMASPQDVRSGVLVDNTTGSAILSMESLSNEVQTSTDPFAQRLRNIPTVDIIGNLLTAFKK